MSDELILVNAQNRAIGRAEKRQVHEAGLLHRAFSIFLIDPAGRILLQQRHPAKYHSGGLWTNSCCGHPHPGEQTVRAAQRRLGEELGASCPLRFGFLTRYDTRFANGLIENEIVYVYFGLAPADITPNPEEISALELVSLAELKAEVTTSPEAYSFWLNYYIVHHLEEMKRGIEEVLKRAEVSVSSNSAEVYLERSYCSS